ncbi:flagellar hook capping FlgD N-terminal domain-containing protein [Acidaminobacter sp.]|uniref:flagellar hook capping FlgD N-terminal domain-containing protein n=1 Tax=Acidaminobacter sp. TaxID=1872102 RepID=UPI00137D3989|nr:flagellar hook capping FlgD N-terminal domain-containing protein [Acidaminobacter sp.]MDK9710581.1 hypothetical protein [Acidaminobacter sp.]MZQ96808.1 hypothetical protein [Acidaminobacter sp.]
MDIQNTNIFANTAASTQQKQSLTDQSSFIGKNDFFKILSAQLKYQDPMSGGDNSEYIAQMSQFAMIEKLENLADQLNTLYNLNSTNHAMSMIGKQVDLETLETGVVSGILERVEISQQGIKYVVNGETYAYPKVLSVGSPVQVIE